MAQNATAESKAKTPPAPPAPPAASAKPEAEAVEASKTAPGETAVETGEVKKRVYRRVSLEGISVDALASGLEVLPEEEAVNLQSVSEKPRSELQQKVDAQVREAHAAWVAAGKPAGFSDGRKKKIVRRYLFDPGQGDAYKSLLNAAGKYLGLKMRFAPVQPHAQSGREQLPWMAMDKPVRKRTEATASDVAAAVTGARK